MWNGAFPALAKITAAAFGISARKQQMLMGRRDKPVRNRRIFAARQKNLKAGEDTMKATGIVRRIDDLGRVVIPKEIRRTLRIREGDPSQKSWTPSEAFCISLLDLAKRQGW